LTKWYGPRGYDGLVNGIANARSNISSSRIFRSFSVFSNGS
jgi:hypothetical protein